MAPAIPPLPRHCNSWIVRERSTGRAVLETSNCALLERINGERFEILTTLDHLVRLNREIREQSQ